MTPRKPHSHLTPDPPPSGASPPSAGSSPADGIAFGRASTDRASTREEASPPAQAPPPRRLFKDWFDAALVEETARRFEAVDPAFDGAAFRTRALDGLEKGEMMERVGQIADALLDALPSSLSLAMDRMIQALPPRREGGGEEEGGVKAEAGGEAAGEATGEATGEAAGASGGVLSSGYLLWPWGEAVARAAGRAGGTEDEAEADDDADAAFRAMVQITLRFTSEFAVRPWLAAHPDAWLDRLEPLVTHPSEHVRRWVSEGTRTRLPWGRRVPALETGPRTERRLRILHALHRDPSPYVRRSVANHLQDALRDNRDLAFPTLARWACSGDERGVATARHAARGLLREGDAETLALFGFPAGGGGVRLARFEVAPGRVRIGEEVRFTLQLEGPDAGEAAGRGGVGKGGAAPDPDTPIPLRLDLRMEHPGAGERVRRKTFRVATLEVLPGEVVERSHTHGFLPRTIRSVRPGPHHFVARLNGVDAGRVVVMVVVVEEGGPGAR